jgi:hypothetical protein
MCKEPVCDFLLEFGEFTVNDDDLGGEFSHHDRAELLSRQGAVLGISCIDRFLCDADAVAGAPVRECFNHIVSPGYLSISIGSVPLATYPVIFFGNVVSLTATSSSKQFPLRNGAGTILVTANDAGGNPVPDEQLWVVTSNPEIAEIVERPFVGNYFPYTVNALKAGSTTISFVSFVDAKGLVAEFSLRTHANADGSAVPGGKYKIFAYPLAPSDSSLAAPFSGGYVTLVGGKAKYTFTVSAAEGEIEFRGTLSSDAKIVPPIADHHYNSHFFNH